METSQWPIFFPHLDQRRVSCLSVIIIIIIIITVIIVVIICIFIAYGFFVLAECEQKM